jgi:anti-sigma factor RsiW
MSCSPFDLKDFFLKELPNAERSQVESHLKACGACREDLDRLQLTEAALFSLRDEEIPQRIAFVSDKIFEPSPARRWLNAFWGSSARLGFASAAMLSCALFFFAVNRTAPAPNRPAVTEQVVAATAPSPTEIQQQIQKAVAVAVADVEARQAEKTTRLVADLEHRTDEIRRSLQLVAGEYELDRKRAMQLSRVSMARPVDGDPK